jgi:manganese/zinc/iron transport system substrate-binding protein
VMWMQAVERIAAALGEVDPQNKPEFDAALDLYLTKLEELDAYAAKVLNSVPESQRVLVTAHDAFNYMGRCYGIEVVGIQGISTESEAGVQDIERLVDLLVSRQIPAVFVESTVAERNIKALVEGAKAKGHTVMIGGTLYSDAMGKAGTYEGTYIGMIDHNVTTIARALGGEVPEGGMQGKLSGTP